MSRFPAPPNPQRWAFAFTALVTATTVPGYAQVAPKRVHVVDKNAPTVVRAEEISGRPERELNLDRDVEIVRDKTRVTADTACFRHVEDEMEAKGHVRIWRFGDYYTGDEVKLNLESGKGYLLNPTYQLELNHAQGKAQRVNFINEDEAVVIDGTYSTCQGPNPDWYLKSSTLNLDSGRDVGVAGKTVVYFKNVPLIGTPALSFSLSGARRSGWLPPIPGFGSKGRAELTVPYYFNIAPNRDLTVYPRLIARRGVQLGAHGRYIGETDAGSYAGDTFVEYLPNDKQADKDRWMIMSNHTQAIAKDWSYGWNVRAASDDNYPNDFSKTVAGSAERQLLRELRSDYRGEYWSLSARVQKYQVLQDPAAITDPSLFVTRPYDRLPAVNFHAARYDVGGFDWQVDAEATSFWHPTAIRGNRMVAIPQISYPIIGPSFFVTPKVMLNASAYQLEAHDGREARSLTRTVPTVSLDSGLVFERDSTLFGRAATQTLEPRLFYVKTPYRDQTDFPVFDTAASTFNFSQIFSENRFVGSDRVGDANQVTAAVVSRFLESSGAERLRLAFGQRFYFSDQRVQLGSTTASQDSKSDMLLAATGRISESWGVDSAVQYNPSDRRVVSSNFALNWMPGPKKVLNLGARFLRDSVNTTTGLANNDGFKNVDLSSQWPLTDRWFGVGRISYSLKDNKILESLVGLEYNGDCWVFRMGAQRFVTTARQASTPIFFQLELNGLSKFGIGNPLEALRNSIPGYQRLNEGSNRH
ncbi:LPS-assembly protein LptD [Pseudoduganella namucuonensis]|uniref:LPS-assembly protein LptD n=1 Tax=Pseudoduganella namucuonensis TaxID=1035707 RepID=A0A1I7M150_9BURK|nr:LPS-assembly protein LptD [Pseudoduganella namucuonensis]SFV15701.1 LPS-assembly protein [Pseudoduganella namucuonensis]